MDRTRRLIETIRMLMEGSFSGHIKINFTQGSIGRVEKSEEMEDVVTILVGESNQVQSHITEVTGN